MPRYEWTGGPNILGALDPGVQLYSDTGRSQTPSPRDHQLAIGASNVRTMLTIPYHIHRHYHAATYWGYGQVYIQKSKLLLGM